MLSSREASFEVELGLALRDLVERRLRDVDVALLDALGWPR
jgi:hypothetical protein